VTTSKHIQELEDAVSILTTRLRSAKADLEAAQQRLAEAQCPFSVGDTVLEPRRKYFWIIDQIKIGYFGTAEMYGRRLKKDGTPYKRKERLWAPSRNGIVKSGFPKK